MNIEFDSEPVYGDNKKYIKAYGDKVNAQKKCIRQIFVIDNATFCY